MKQEIILCDRCKKEIAPSVFPKMFGRLERTIQFKEHPISCGRDFFELCGSCTKAFEEFMKEDT